MQNSEAIEIVLAAVYKTPMNVPPECIKDFGLALDILEQIGASFKSVEPKELPEEAVHEGFEGFVESRTRQEYNKDG